MIRAASQPIGGLLRVGLNYNGYPDDWDYQVTYASTDGRHVVLLGLKGDGAFSAEHRTAIFHECWRLGFRTAFWERIEERDGVKVVRPVHVAEHRLRAGYEAQEALLSAAGCRFNKEDNLPCDPQS